MKLSLHDLNRLPVMGEKKRSGVRKRVGRVGDVVFHPEKPVAIGFVVSRPNVLLVFQRKDRLLALDRATILADKVVVDGKQAWGSSAAKRLEISWDQAVIWRGMPVRTAAGKELGYVRDAVIDEESGRLNALGITSGIAADVAVGAVDLPASLVTGWDGAAIVVADEAGRVDPAGGAAAVAGKATAVAQDRTAKAAAAAARGAKTATAYTKSAVRVAAKSETGKKVGGFLKSVRDQIVEAAGVPDDEDKK